MSSIADLGFGISARPGATAWIKNYNRGMPEEFGEYNDCT